MKETKVYVDELPEICDECPCHSVMEDRCVLLRKQAIEPFLQSCPLKSLKTHDRELVKEVCEKIRKEIESQTDVRIAVNNFNTITGHGLEYVFRRIQKEHEK